MEAESEKSEFGRNESDWMMLVHLSSLVMLLGIPSFVGPLLVWLWKKDKCVAVDDHGREALNFQLTYYVYSVIATAVAMALMLSIIGIPLLVMSIPLAALFFLVMTICPVVAALKAKRGGFFRYPLTVRLL